MILLLNLSKTDVRPRPEGFAISRVLQVPPHCLPNPKQWDPRHKLAMTAGEGGETEEQREARHLTAKPLTGHNVVSLSFSEEVTLERSPALWSLHKDVLKQDREKGRAI